MIFYDNPSDNVLWAAVELLDVPVYLHPRFQLCTTLRRPAVARCLRVNQLWIYILGLATSGVFDMFPGVQRAYGGASSVAFLTLSLLGAISEEFSTSFSIDYPYEDGLMEGSTWFDNLDPDVLAIGRENALRLFKLDGAPHILKPETTLRDAGENQAPRLAMSALAEEDKRVSSVVIAHPDPEKEAINIPASKEHEDVLAIEAAALAEFDDPNLDKDAAIAGILEDDSPYPEVRSAVANTDDPTIPVATLRAWTLGLICAIIIPGLNQFFFFRFPSVTVGSLVAQLLVFPVGRVWARIVPNVSILGISLNPGPFTIKEHVLVTIMAGVGSGSAYATDIVAVQRVYYDQTFNFSYQWLMVMTHRFLYWGHCSSIPCPAPVHDLAISSFQYAGVGNRGGYSRERFFYIAFGCAAVYYILPGYLFGALSYFSWVCWIAPDNLVVNQLFGIRYGLAMSVVTFDWSQIVSFLGSPLATPWWAEANIIAGFLAFFWVLTPALYFTNTWYAKYMPISSPSSFDNTGKTYQVRNILTDSAFDEAKYKAYSPIFLPTTFAISYGLSFASITATITHAFLFFRKQIWTQSRRAMHEQPDIHARLMAVYPQVPEWWYGIIFVTMFVFGVVVIEVWDTKFPGESKAVGLNVITELIIGYALPGHPVAMMMFKTWGYITMAQALTFTSDFKLGHYMKIPPRQMFLSQIVATILAGTVQLGVQESAWMFENIPDICDPGQKDGFTCPNTTVFGTASIIWGAIGPARQFSKGQIYYGLVFFFLIGFICPLLVWLATLRWPNSMIRYLNFPVVFSGTGLIPPANSANYVSWAIVGFIFQYVIRRRKFSWWTKFKNNYVLSAALDAGLAVSAVLIFFILQYPKNGTIGLNNVQAWWGNTVYTKTADWNRTPMIKLAEGETFGPATW
ncbi:OPT oligopeptide transporter [Mycena kentingensis (nom. inval.)]|nr:OPT oligopeptide transporter [Mycena kentingensis (nom. inval.)]